MNNTIIIKVSNYLNRFIKKCIDYKINIDNITYIDENNLTCRINIKDYKIIKKINYYSDIKVIKYEGINGLKIHIRKYLYHYLVIIFCFILMDIITSYTIKIDVIHENSSIRNLVIDELKNHGIKKYSLAYDFNELEQIKKDILNNNPNTLEWLSINRVGMNYIVRVEERIIKSQDNPILPRDVIALKDGLVTKVISSKGENKVRSGDYVKKGDVLISGHIYLYDEIKGLTSATGVVYGNVWYDTLVKIPREKEVVNETGRKRYNININNKILLKNKYANFKQKNIKELKILGLTIKIYQEIEYERKVVSLSNEEIDKCLEEKIIETFNKKLKDKGTIVSQKVLKKVENDSTIEYRVFVVTNEIISDYLYISEGDENDTSKSD